MVRCLSALRDAGIGFSESFASNIFGGAWFLIPLANQAVAPLVHKISLTAGTIIIGLHYSQKLNLTSENILCSYVQIPCTRYIY